MFLLNHLYMLPVSEMNCLMTSHLITPNQILVLFLFRMAESQFQ